MSHLTYYTDVNPKEKPLFRFNGVEVSTPPMGPQARQEAGYLLGLLQQGEALGLPQARPLFDIAPRLYELRIKETGKEWRIFYRTDPDRILLVHQTNKTTRTITDQDRETIVNRLKTYDVLKATGTDKKGKK